ncbi:unnamed protein product, partial [Darwinula stevensoni]
NTHQRESILKLILGQEPISKDVNLTELAEKTPGYSGSDLRELCRTAAMLSVRAQFRVEASSGETFGPITRASFEQAIAKINTSKVPRHLKMFYLILNSFKEVQSNEITFIQDLMWYFAPPSQMDGLSMHQK